MVYHVPPINLIGKDCLNDAGEQIKNMGCKKAFISTDKFLTQNGTVKKVTNILDEIGIAYIVYNEAKPNPTVKNVEDGLKILKKEKCDLVISIGGGSPQDCGKAIAILATNGGNIKNYEGVNKTTKKSLPIVAITTTAGTSAEVTINYVITDEERHVKMIMVDTNSLAYMTINDPELMVSMPASLTAATGMDALTHAIEAVVANGANDVTDATALYSIKEIFKFLPRAVKNGQDIEAREQMCYACYLNGIAFSNAGLGNVHAMAHQLGGLYDLPHGVCNAILLPVVEEENAKGAPEKFRLIAETIGYDVNDSTNEECVDYVIGSIKKLSEEVGIPKSLREVGVSDPDFDTLAENAMKDACAAANPVFFSKEKLIELFRKIA
ncbi:MAG: iron-containing alcohol dehydrogenase [Clostridium sp.]|jgi:alcohol dehydrogenase class IV|uniref:iron-containing alcohol dehydrogenase n=1 Tax=Clostridium sp. TaxID=1506 RepID=UPI0025C3C406|nr:iron-containing alcohol dehydrogenase [Clostridium sp.]MCH3963444.1 iron-containing alcohol dehydrogenase [Clostridium sp.]MCI1716688.1 iron-containing alcohol dehydrogenase [Clostridium sp.]MCI1801128.1 iron-containing alcohol dehydrogenase [Clostridium sp.]MCI1814874.1 iron-containing alcohol dehydrogenase [Clostridium sp.]MCI1871775.1 iron-containing alcohol dehydrogenase [Clostridium sp.]